jgi:threonine dehydrogenase-like Zn-dependent dehydrogenase
MRALQFDHTLQLHTDVPLPILQPGEVLLKTRLAGICNTDLELMRGYMNFSGTLGHEFVAEVAEDAAGFRAGERVVGEINVACGECDYCRAGLPNHCRERSVLGILNYPGAFADYLKLLAVNLHRVPAQVSDAWAVFTEPLAAALQLTRVTPVRPTDRVVLVGAGKLGLLIAQVLKLTGCDLTVVARHARTIELLQKWGLAVAPSVDALPKFQADMVVEVTGSADGFNAALELVKPGGTIALKSTYAGLPQFDISRVVVNEIRVVGSRCGPFEAALRLMEHHLVDLDSLVDALYSLSEAHTAFETAAERGRLKVLLQP